MFLTYTKAKEMGLEICPKCESMLFSGGRVQIMMNEEQIADCKPSFWSAGCKMDDPFHARIILCTGDNTREIILCKL